MVGDEPNLRTYYYHTDHLGSIRAVSNSNGNIVGLYTYDSFGNVVQEVSYPDADRLRFTGKRLDSTGLYYFNARYYDSTLGRFISADPARQGLNWYVYCNNNPLMFVDPDGKEPVMMWYTEVYSIEIENPEGVFVFVIDNMGPNKAATIILGGAVLLYEGSKLYLLIRYGVMLPSLPLEVEAALLAVSANELIDNIESNKKVKLTPSGNELLKASYERKVILKRDVAYIEEMVGGQTYSQFNYYHYRISRTPDGSEYPISHKNR